MLNESNKDEVIEDILKWCNEILKKESKVMVQNLNTHKHYLPLSNIYFNSKLKR